LRARIRLHIRVPLRKEVYDALYFKLKDLAHVSDYLREMEHHFTINLSIKYDTKVALKTYDMFANKGVVSIKKIDGDTYVTTTEKGGAVCYNLFHTLLYFQKPGSGHVKV
jgi:hypothetical protein